MGASCAAAFFAAAASFAAASFAAASAASEGTRSLRGAGSTPRGSDGRAVELVGVEGAAAAAEAPALARRRDVHEEDALPDHRRAAMLGPVMSERAGPRTPSPALAHVDVPVDDKARRAPQAAYGDAVDSFDVVAEHPAVTLAALPEALAALAASSRLGGRRRLFRRRLLRRRLLRCRLLRRRLLPPPSPLPPSPPPPLPPPSPHPAGSRVAWRRRTSSTSPKSRPRRRRRARTCRSEH